MATLESKCTKYMTSVSGRQIAFITEGWDYAAWANPNDWIHIPLDPFTWSRYSVGAWGAGNLLVGSKRCVTGLMAWSYVGPILGPVNTFETVNYTVEYDFSELINTLQFAHTPPDDLILSIWTPYYGGEFEKLLISYGNQGESINIPILDSEGPLVTVSSKAEFQYDYLKRIINDMYKNIITSRSIFIRQDITITEDTGCGWMCSEDYAYYWGDIYCRLQSVPSNLGIWLYVIDKIDIPDITVAPKEDEKIDVTTPNMEKEQIEPETEDEEPDSGLNEYNVRDYSYTNEEGMQVLPPNEFDYIYIPESIDLTNIDSVVVGVGIVAGHIEGAGLTHTNIYVKEINNSFQNIDTMSFVEYSKYDETGIFDIGDKVFGLIYGETRFLGWIKSKNRSISENEQYIEYQAVGAKGWLQTLPFSVQYKAKDKSIQWLFNDISSKIPRSIVNYVSGISLLPTSIIPEIRADAASFGYSLDLIIDYARKYGFYLNYDKTLTVYDLKNLSIIDLDMPLEGEYLKEHPEYKILSKNLSVDVSNCRTRCILRGDYPIREYDEIRSVSWENNIGIINLNKIIQSNLISNTSIPIYVYNKVGENITPYNIIYVDCNTGIIKITGQVQNNLHIRYCVKELESLKYDSGWQGTAYDDYKIQQVLIKNDIRFRKIILPEGIIRNDTGLMPSYAKNLLDPLKDWKIGGTVILDGLILNITIGKAVRINNSGCSELNNVSLAVMQITWDFENNTTQLSLSNDYYLGSSIPDPINDEKYDERKLIEQVTLTKGKQQDFPWVFNL